MRLGPPGTRASVTVRDAMGPRLQGRPLSMPPAAPTSRVSTATLSASTLSSQQRRAVVHQLVREQGTHERGETRTARADAILANELFEGSLHLARALPPLFAVLGQGAHDDRLERGRVVRADARRERVLAIADELERLVLARRLEEAPARRELEEHDADGEDVAPPVDASPRACSGDMYGTLPLSWPLSVSSPGRASLLAMPKSTTFTSPVNVTMTFCGDTSRCTMLSGAPFEIALLVRIREARRRRRARSRARAPSGTRGRSCVFICADDGSQVLALDVLHRDEVRAVDLPDVEDLDDVRVRERGRDARLVEEHLDERLVLVHRGQDALDDDELLEARRRFAGSRGRARPCRRSRACARACTCRAGEEAPPGTAHASAPASCPSALPLDRRAVCSASSSQSAAKLAATS